MIAKYGIVSPGGDGCRPRAVSERCPLYVKATALSGRTTLICALLINNKKSAGMGREMPSKFCFCAVAIAAAALAGCGGGGDAPPEYTLSGTAAGLSGQLILQYNGANDLALKADGPFQFASPIASGTDYSVTIKSQPPNQTCSLSQASGVASANMAPVAASCATNTYTIGGTVSGLVRPISLKDNLGDALTLLVNGPFTFQTPATGGSAYSVSLVDQGPAQTCRLTSGSGTATAPITSVSVSCSANMAASFLPLSATPQTSAGGATGLFVMPTDMSIQAPQRVTQEPMRGLGFALAFSSAAGVWSAGLPNAFVYFDTDLPGNHLWVLDLTATSTLVPRQLTNFTGDSCSRFVAMKDLLDASSLFVILGTPGGSVGDCSSPGHVLIRLTDASTTTPTTVGMPPGTVVPLYSPDGTLAGLVGVDAKQNLDFYPDETFSNPTTLLSGVASVGRIAGSTMSEFTDVATDPTYALIDVINQSTGTSSLYRVDYQGHLSAKLYDWRGDMNGALEDSTNLYVVDRFSNAVTIENDLLQIPLASDHAAQLIYSEVNNVTAANDFAVVGLAGDQILLEHALFIDPVTSLRSSDVFTVPATGAITPHVIASYDQWINCFYSPGAIAVLRMIVPSNTFPSTQYATELITPQGVELQPLLTQSSWMTLGGNPLIQVRGISDSGGLGGGAMVLVDPTSPGSSQPFTTPDGEPFVFPTSDFGYAFVVSSALAVGEVDQASSQDALLFDLSHQVVQHLSMPSTFLVFERSALFY